MCIHDGRPGGCRLIETPRSLVEQLKHIMADPQVQRLQQELFAARQAYATAQKTGTELAASLQDSKEENDALRAQLRQQQQLQEEARSHNLKSEELEGLLVTQQAEAKRLRGRNAVLDEELKRCAMHAALSQDAHCCGG